MDPTDISLTSVEIQAKHKENFSLLNKKLIDVLRQIHGDMGYGAGPWTMLVHSGIGHNCIKYVSSLTTTL